MKIPIGELRYYVFDMLFLNDLSMLELPLLQRKSLIPEVIEDTGLTTLFIAIMWREWELPFISAQ